jgi:hypothetical protein
MMKNSKLFRLIKKDVPSFNEYNSIEEFNR